MRFSSANQSRGRNNKFSGPRQNASESRRQDRGKSQSGRQRSRFDDSNDDEKSMSSRKKEFQRNGARPSNRYGRENEQFSRNRFHGGRKFERKNQPKDSYNEDSGVRLNKYIANAGVCSRRDAEQYITAGVISINGKIVTELATKVYYGDVVKFNNAPLMPEKKTYILLNKPKDYVTTTDDPHAEKTVMDLISDASKNRVYPVGRLDRATTGLLLLTNDGDLAEHLCHPRYNKQKIYQVTLDRKVDPADIEKLLMGVELEDGVAKADDIEYCNPDDPCEVGVVIHSGRNRIVRRMFEHLKYKVKKLDRVYYAGLTKKNLPRGKWRFLTDQEVSMLKRGAYK